MRFIQSVTLEFPKISAILCYVSSDLRLKCTVRVQNQVILPYLCLPKTRVSGVPLLGESNINLQENHKKEYHKSKNRDKNKNKMQREKKNR